MKRLTLVLGLIALFAIGMQAQTYSLSDVQVDAVETINSGVINVTSGDVLLVQIVCAEDGGTSDGTVVTQESIDGSTWFPLDTLTITSSAKEILRFYKEPVDWPLLDLPYKLRFAVTGTANDTTTVSFDYSLKK